jgi:crossover junction endodeoxyribonuclease RusA
VTVYRFEFPWTKAPLSLNDRLHHMVKAKKTAELRSLMAREAAHVGSLRWPIEVALVWVVKDTRRRDEENIVATLKPLCDGLVDAGIVPDDTPEFMVKRMPAIWYEKGAKPHFELTVWEVEHA